MDSEKVIVVNISGRGDKDIYTVADIEGIKLYWGELKRLS